MPKKVTPKKTVSKKKQKDDQPGSPLFKVHTQVPEAPSQWSTTTSEELDKSHQRTQDFIRDRNAACAEPPDDKPSGEAPDPVADAASYAAVSYSDEAEKQELSPADHAFIKKIGELVQEQTKKDEADFDTWFAQQSYSMGAMPNFTQVAEMKRAWCVARDTLRSSEPDE